jgi:hypothetical protein
LQSARKAALSAAAEIWRCSWDRCLRCAPVIRDSGFGISLFSIINLRLNAMNGRPQASSGQPRKCTDRQLLADGGLAAA